MKILILGGGQDGIILSYLLSVNYGIKPYIALRKKYNSFFEKYTTSFEVGSFIENENILRELISKLNPTHIINTVALSSTIECKKNPEIAFAINTDFPIKLANVIKELNIQLIHFGSILEKESRDKCIYTTSKKLTSSFLNNFESNLPIINLSLPNHESPLRDERFFIRELITKFNNQNFLDPSNQEKIFLRDGTTERIWSWAPNIMNKVIKMILENKNTIEISDDILILSLMQFVKIVADELGLNNLIVECGESGTHKQKEIHIEEVNQNIKEWISVLFFIKFEERFKLEKWCKVI